MAAHAIEKLVLWSVGFPVAAGALLALKFAGLITIADWPGFVLAALLLGGAVFSAVHHAEVIALKVGEPFGSILLAIAVTVIEVALIVSILLTNMADSAEVARDTVYATVMIVLNGVVGTSLIVGGWKHREQVFRIDGAAASLAVLGTLATFALVLPNFTLANPAPIYSPLQLCVVGGASLALYSVFVFVQTIRHREYFLESGPVEEPPSILPSDGITFASAALLVLALTSVVLLAKLLSKPLEEAILSAGLPGAFLGVVIAAVVLLPEGIAALRAAAANRLQSSINLALGSAVASIGLTIPAVATASLLLGVPLVLGISGENTVLLVLTLFASTLTLGTGRTTVLQGTVHLVIFAVFLLLSAIP